MAATATQQSCGTSSTFEVLIRNLPCSAREAIVAALPTRPDDWTAVSSARLACRTFRDLVDEETTEVAVNSNKLRPADLIALSAGGRWLQRWPRCKSVTIICDETCLGTLTAPFALAPPEACRRIKHLAVVQVSGTWTALSSDTWMGLITRLPELTTLVLEVLAPDPGDDSLDQAVLMHALSQLPCLTDLTVADSYFLPSIPDCLARQLTRLAVKLPDDVVDSPTADLEACLPRSIALKELVVEAKHDGVLEEADVRQLLDASPPSLASVQVALVGPSLLAFSCELAGGVLSSVSIGGLAGADLPPYDAVAAVLAMAVLPSRVLGPRLPLLKLEGLSLASGTSVPGPALELLSRCDRIDVNTLAAGPSAEHTYGVVRLLGLPRKLLWEAYPGALGTVLLRGPRPGEPASRNGGGGGGDCGGESRARQCRVLSPTLVVARAVERLARAPPRPTDLTPSLLLRGPLIFTLAHPFPEVFQAWLQRLASAASVALTASNTTPPGTPHGVTWYRTMWTAGAALVTCSSPTMAAALAAMSGQLAAAATRMPVTSAGSPSEPVEVSIAQAISAGGSGGAALLEAVPCRLTWAGALVQVLQALWDGEEEGEGETGGPGADGASASASVGSSSGGGGGGVTGELERVRCLLGTWEGLKRLEAASSSSASQ